MQFLTGKEGNGKYAYKGRGFPPVSGPARGGGKKGFPTFRGGKKVESILETEKRNLPFSKKRGSCGRNRRELPKGGGGERGDPSEGGTKT